MNERIIISEIKITKAGEIKFFEIPLPKNTTRIIGVGIDFRLQTAWDMIGVHDVGIGIGGDDGGSEVIGGGHDSDPVIDLIESKLAGKMIIQSMEKANIFFYDQVWAYKYDDGISNLESVESMKAFTVIRKPEPKAVDVPCNTIILNCLYRDSLGADSDSDVVYFVKVLLWVEYNQE